MLPQDKKNFNFFINLYKKRNLKLFFIFENEKVKSLKELKIKFEEYKKYKSFNDFL
jgi:hypothetical protein